MDSKEIIYCLKGIVEPYVQNDLAFKNFDRETDFIKDLEINSANLVDIILDVEDEFNIAIENDAMENMMTVDDAVKIIQDKQAQR